ncbi:EamA family transporter [Terriglobus aquaticus]|uniref:EamA family transporter n=1 Tax=Terriglobus aquaticus TaxID=940139 RepID=A0ABW9KKM0_9BACT|nr:EamA family transporter [Terriglobus aquaticus]
MTALFASTLVGGNALPGLLAAALWGGGDFAGSYAVKLGGGTVRASLRVVVIGHLLSLLALVATGLALHVPLHDPRVLVWALVGGVVSGTALMAFYLALANGHMGAGAAVSGLLCAAIPAVVSALQEGAPGWKRLVGFGLAAAAIWLVASASNPEHTDEDRATARKSMLLSVLGGLGFGVYFTALKFSSGAGVVWSTAAARVGSWGVSALLLAGTLLFARRRNDDIEPPSHISARNFWWILGGSLLDLGGNLAFVTATRMGRLDVAAVLASLYPAGTILLAAGLLHEKTNTRQRMGMVLALPAVVLVTL